MFRLVKSRGPSGQVVDSNPICSKVLLIRGLFILFSSLFKAAFVSISRVCEEQPRFVSIFV